VAIGTGLLGRRDHAAHDAAEILERTWVDEGTQIQIPVDVVRIARALGLEVFDVGLDSNISGALVREPGADPTILLNESDSENRRHFSCAHEIGHFVRRSQDGGSERYEFVDYRGPLAAQGIDADEIYANQFAANLLMPEAEVKRLYKKGIPIVALAVEFLVSEDAMRFRLENLGLV